MKIGFIGLGHMGSGIAANLLKAGHELTVWNRSSAPAEALGEKARTLHTRPKKHCKAISCFRCSRPTVRSAM